MIKAYFEFLVLADIVVAAIDLKWLNGIYVCGASTVDLMDKSSRLRREPESARVVCFNSGGTYHEIKANGR